MESLTPLVSQGPIIENHGQRAGQQEEKDLQFYQSTSGTQHRTDMNGGCWSCSFYTSEQTCCSLKNKQRNSHWVIEESHI